MEAMSWARPVGRHLTCASPGSKLQHLVLGVSHGSAHGAAGEHIFALNKLLWEAPWGPAGFWVLTRCWVSFH